MSTSTNLARHLSQETHLPQWWFDVTLGSIRLGCKAENAHHALCIFEDSPQGSLESAAAYKKYSELACVHESQINDIWIRHWAFYNDFYERLGKATTIPEIVGMLREPGVIPGSPLWENGLKKIVNISRKQV